MDNLIRQAAARIKESQHTTVFTGAGISVESGIPPFRGKDGLWSKYDPHILDIEYFKEHPDEAWVVIKEIFYDFFGKAKPNSAHKFVAELENLGRVKTVITQNIDSLHQEAGSKNVFEFHGTSRTMSCILCGREYNAQKVSLEALPPRCNECGGVLKPDFVFFGEPIPKQVNMLSFYEAKISEVFLVIGTTGQVMPACQVPIFASQNGTFIIEVNTEPSAYTHSITNIFLRGKASEVLAKLVKEIKK